MKRKRSFYYTNTLVLLSSLLLTEHLFSTKTQAQVTPDQTLGLETSIVAPIDVANELIVGGAKRGGNLFHSFQDFNIGEGKSVFFANPQGVMNIFSRVTGGNPSQILGRLGVLGTSNLFFLNPNGVLFGPNASLALSGSLLVSTANSIRFADGSEFSTNLAQNNSLLTISVPVGLQFDASPASITNQSRFTTLLPSFSDPNTIEPVTVGLFLFPGKTLALVGGDINLEGGNLTAFQGKIELGAVDANSTVNISSTGENWQLDYQQVQNFKDITLSEGSSIDASGSSSGTITLNGSNITLSNNSRLVSFNIGTQQGGDIIVNAIRSFNIEGTSNFVEAVQINANGLAKPSDLQNGVFTVGYGQGDAGNIIINSNQFIARNGAFLQTSTAGSANGGDIILNVSDFIELTASIVVTATGPNQTTGNAGNLTIDTGTLILRDNGLATTSTLGFGRGGNLTVNASQQIELFGANPIPIGNNIFLTTGLVTNSFSFGSAGNLKLTTNRLNARDGSVISVGTFAGGDGGNLNVQASEIRLSGKSLDNRYPSQISAFAQINSRGSGGNVSIRTRTLSVQKDASISATNLGIGNAGNVDIIADSVSVEEQGIIEAASQFGQGGNIILETKNLFLNNRAFLTANSQGIENAGNITIRVQNNLTSNNSTISTSANQASGGNITISAQDIRLRGDGDIRTNVVSGAGGGGDITLTADSILAFGDSDIIASAKDGIGGNITLNTPIFFGNGYSPTDQINQNSDNLNNNRVDINASGAVSGVINLPDLTFIQNSLFELPETLINTENLLASSCVVPNQQKAGTFILTGPDGLPTRPNRNLTSPYPTGIIETIPKPSPSKIDEPQGFYRLNDGKIVLSTKCF